MLSWAFPSKTIRRPGIISDSHASVSNKPPISTSSINFAVILAICFNQCFKITLIIKWTLGLSKIKLKSVPWWEFPQHYNTLGSGTKLNNSQWFQKSFNDGRMMSSSLENQITLTMIIDSPLSSLNQNHSVLE